MGKEVMRSNIIKEANLIIGQWFGKEVLLKISATYIKGDTLYFSITTPVLKQEITLRRDQLLAELQKKFGSTIKSISTTL